MDNTLNSIMVNPIPSKTWNWLKMNESNVEFPSDVSALPEGSLTVKAFDNASNDASACPDSSVFEDIENGVGEDVKKVLDAAGSEPAYITAGAGESLVKLDFDLDNKGRAGEVRFYVPAGCKMKAVMDYKSAKGSFALISAKAYVEEGASFELIQIHRTDDDSVLLDNVGTACEKDAGFKLTQAFVSGGRIYAGACCDLRGDRSAFDIRSGYRIYDDHELDINYIARHRGAKTDSNINVSGVLQNTAVKRFRGTIDFIYGSVAATGNEKEDVLLLDEDVVNKTVPIILCEEEDVEGNHGATIGRLSEDLEFYLQSRGLDKDSIYKLMSMSALMSVCRSISDEETKEELLGYLSQE